MSMNQFNSTTKLKRDLGRVQFLMRAYLGGDDFEHPNYVYDPMSGDIIDSYLYEFTGESPYLFSKDKQTVNIIEYNENVARYNFRKKYAVYTNYCDRIVNRYLMIAMDLYNNTIITNSELVIKKYSIEYIIRNLLIWGYIGLRFNEYDGSFDVLDPREQFITRVDKDKYSFQYINVSSEDLGVSGLNLLDYNKHYAKGIVLSFTNEYKLSDSVINNAANKSREAMNIANWLHTILRDQTFSILTYQTKEDEKALRNEMAIGVDQALVYFEGTARPEYIAPSSEPARILMDRLDQIKSEIDYTSGLFSVADSLTEKHSGISLSLLYDEKYTTLYWRAQKILDNIKYLYESNLYFQNKDISLLGWKQPNITEEMKINVKSELINKEGNNVRRNTREETREETREDTRDTTDQTE